MSSQFESFNVRIEAVINSDSKPDYFTLNLITINIINDFESGVLLEKECDYLLAKAFTKLEPDRWQKLLEPKFKQYYPQK